MYSLSNEKEEYYCHIQCDCGRKYRAEEMYICYNCNKILCRFCLNDEIEYCFCKNYCKINQSLSVNQAKKMKNTCDQCLECPLCGVALIKRIHKGLYMYVCPYCYWDTANIKFACQKETDLDSLIHQLKESTNKGLLKKMYDHIVTKLKENEGLSSEIPGSVRSSLTRSSLLNDVSYQVNKAMEMKTWDINNIDTKLKEEEKKMEEKNLLNYEDNYYQQHNNYCAFNAVASLLACGMDYSEKSISKIETIEGLKDKLKNDLDVSFISSLEQRLNHVTFQHPSNSVLFPKFVDLIPKKSKRCKFCKKFIVQAQDVSKNQGQKLELCHLFLNQFPYCSIFRIDPTTNTLLLKFIIFDFKETKISFEECTNSPVRFILPTGVYEVSESFTNNAENKLEPNEYIYSKTDRCVILNFRWEPKEAISSEGNQFNTIVTDNNEITKNISDDLNENIVARFKVKAEYFRLEAKNLDYIIEIKFKNKS